MKKFDFILIGIIALLAAAALLIISNQKNDGAFAVIEQNGHEIYRVALDSPEKDYTVKSDTGYNIIRIGNGCAFFLEADCKDGICVAHTKLSYSGDISVCLPHKVVLHIEGGESSDFDAIAE